MTVMGVSTSVVYALYFSSRHSLNFVEKSLLFIDTVFIFRTRNLLKIVGRQDTMLRSSFGSASDVSESSDRSVGYTAEEKTKKRLEQVHGVVEKRCENMAYIKRAYEGGRYWMNSVLMERRDLEAIEDNIEIEKRVQQYFYLGLGLARVKDLGDGVLALRGCTQLLEEWEYHFSTNAVQSMKAMLATSSDTYFPNQSTAPITIQEGPGGHSSVPEIRPSIMRVGQRVVYEMLVTPHIPCELDYSQVVFALADTLAAVYRAIGSAAATIAQHPPLFAALTKMDHRIKHHVVNLIGKELTSVGSARAQSALQAFRAM